MLNFFSTFASLILGTLRTTSLKAQLRFIDLEDRITPYAINVGALASSNNIVYDDGISSACVLQSDGSYYAADLSDAIGLSNTIPQGGNGSTTGPAGAHQIYINSATVFITARLPVLSAQAVITGNSLVATSTGTALSSPFYGYPQYDRPEIFAHANLVSTGAFRVLHSISNSLELNNLNIQAEYGGWETGNGGAILFEGTDLGITLHGCIVSGATTGNGGGLYSTRQVTVENCFFVDNFAENAGAIYMESASAQGVSIHDSGFRNCNASNNGGALWASTLGYVDIGHTGFAECSGSLGGALYIWESFDTSISVSYFDECYSDSGAAGYIHDSNTFSLTSCLMSNCWNSTGDYYDTNAFYGNLNYDPTISGNVWWDGGYYFFNVLHPVPHYVTNR